MIDLRPLDRLTALELKTLVRLPELKLPAQPSLLQTLRLSDSMLESFLQAC